MVFVDGENLLLRFQAMLKAGCIPHGRPQSGLDSPVTAHSPGRYVWNANIPPALQDGPLVRVTYYTTFSGASEDLNLMEDEIAGLKANLRLRNGHFVNAATSLVPKVYKKQKSGHKTKSVDVNICVDMLLQAHQRGVDDLVLVSGDGDYTPLVSAAMAAGKRVHVAALSSGLSPMMRRVADNFVDLDRVLFAS